MCINHKRFKVGNSCSRVKFDLYQSIDIKLYKSILSDQFN
jgi:hypothetical protein